MSGSVPAVLGDQPESSGSVRLRVARTALDAASKVRGVLGADAGPSGLRLTGDPASGVMVGVSVTAQADGRYEVDLSLIADMVPLPQLAEAVRAHVRERAQRERLDDVLGSINVEFSAVMTAGELAAIATAAAEAEALAAHPRAVEQTRAPGPVAEERAGPEAAGEPRPAAPAAHEHRLLATAEDATSAVREAAALATRQAALATDQAALAAKQAALAAEQAALAAAPPLSSSPVEREDPLAQPKDDDQEQTT